MNKSVGYIITKEKLRVATIEVYCSQCGEKGNHFITGGIYSGFYVCEPGKAHEATYNQVIREVCREEAAKRDTWKEEMFLSQVEFAERIKAFTNMTPEQQRELWFGNWDCQTETEREDAKRAFEESPEFIEKPRAKGIFKAKVFE